MEKAKQLALYVKDQKPEDTPELSIEEIFHTVRDANHDYMELRAKENDWKVEREMLRERLLALAPFRPLNFNLHNVLQFRYIKFRIGLIGCLIRYKIQRKPIRSWSERLRRSQQRLMGLMTRSS